MEKARPSYTYAERIMKQMGWTEGKGLGKNEDGIVGLIEVKMQAGTKGIGFSDNDEQLAKCEKHSNRHFNGLKSGYPMGREKKQRRARERKFKLDGHAHTGKQVNTNLNHQPATHQKKWRKKKKKRKGDAIMKTVPSESLQKQSCEQLDTTSSQQADPNRKASRKKKRGDANMTLPAECPQEQGQATIISMQRLDVASRKEESSNKNLQRTTDNCAIKRVLPEEAPSGGNGGEPQSWQVGHSFQCGYRMPPVDYETATAMACWVLDTVDRTADEISLSTACYLTKEEYAELLANHIYKQHRTTNWMQIPGYASKLWRDKCISLMTSTLRKTVQPGRDLVFSSGEKTAEAETVMMQALSADSDNL